MAKFYVQVVDGSGVRQWAEVEAEDVQKARDKVNNDPRGWRADSFAFDASNHSDAMGQIAQVMGGPQTIAPAPWGTFQQGVAANPAANTFGGQATNPGFSDALNPATVFRSFLNRAGGPGASSGVGRLAAQQLTPIAQSVIDQQLNLGTTHFTLPGASGADNYATLANLLGAGGLGQVTTSANDIFNLLASGAGTDPSIVNPASVGEQAASQDVVNLARGSLLGQNPESMGMINRLVAMATNNFMEQQRNVTGGTPSANLADYIRNTIGVNRFDPVSTQF